jgi:molecular chaperone GrpE (heat shock protein)
MEKQEAIQSQPQVAAPTSTTAPMAQMPPQAASQPTSISSQVNSLIFNELRTLLKEQNEQGEKALSELEKTSEEMKSNTKNLLTELKWKVGKASTDIENASYRCKKEIEAIGESIGKQVASEISPSLENALKDISASAKNIKLKSKQNIFLSFALTLLILLVALAGLAYTWKFHDGTKIAEARVAKILMREKEAIRQNAVEQYRNSLAFHEDACKEVAENFNYTRTEYYLFKYINKSDIKRYRLDDFYKFLKRGSDQYKAAKKE